MELVVKPDAWFTEQLATVRCSDDARAYIVGVLVKYMRAEDDMSDESVVLAFADAKTKGDFNTFQRIGDWTLWVSSFYPHRNRGQRDLVETFGRLSYFACHRIMRGQWRLYEELADELPAIVYDIRCNMRRLMVRSSHEERLQFCQAGLRF